MHVRPVPSQLVPPRPLPPLDMDAFPSTARAAALPGPAADPAKAAATAGFEPQLSAGVLAMLVVLPGSSASLPDARRAGEPEPEDPDAGTDDGTDDEQPANDREDGGSPEREDGPPPGPPTLAQQQAAFYGRQAC